MRRGHASTAGTGGGCKPASRSILVFWGMKNIHTEFHVEIIKCKVVEIFGIRIRRTDQMHYIV